jgi:hypothetical protein
MSYDVRKSFVIVPLRSLTCFKPAMTVAIAAVHLNAGR